MIPDPTHDLTAAQDAASPQPGQPSEPGKPGKRQRGARRADRAPVLHRLLVVVLALAGCSVLLYPSAGNWFSDRAHAAAVTGYTETVDSLPLGERAQMLEDARTYNESLAQGRIEDPYGLAAAGPVAPTADATTTTPSSDATATDAPTADSPSAGATSTTGLDYLDQLSLTPSGTMARLRIPDLGSSLPVYHGTSDETLSRGVGHLQGSALPVGGLGTNSVLTGHSGMPQARLFTDLHDLRGGELISVDVLGETLTYRVDSISTVLPTETDLLQPVEDEDLLTLVTCTPVGVNSHRLVVQAHRVDTDDARAATTVGGVAGPGFPWWAVALGAALVGGTWFVWRPKVTLRRPAEARHAAGRGLQRTRAWRGPQAAR